MERKCWWSVHNRDLPDCLESVYCAPLPLYLPPFKSLACNQTVRFGSHVTETERRRVWRKVPPFGRDKLDNKKGNRKTAWPAHQNYNFWGCLIGCCAGECSLGGHRAIQFRVSAKIVLRKVLIELSESRPIPISADISGLFRGEISK